MALGALTKVAHGWYTATANPAEAPWDEHLRIATDRVHAVADVLSPGLVITGPHAALLHGADVRRFPERVDVLGATPASTTHGPVAFRRHVRRLSPEDVSLVGGIPATSPARTAIEVARMYGPAEGLIVADSLMRRQFDEFEDRRDRSVGDAAMAVFRAAAQEILTREPRRRGNPAAHAVIQWADGRAQTPIETEARRGCLVLGLPAPTLQVPVRTSAGTFFPDLTISVEVDGRLVVVHIETDGEVKYQKGIDRDHERLREAAIRQCGHRLARLSGYQITHELDAALRRLVLPLFPLDIRRSLAPVTELDTAQWVRRAQGRRRFR